jgi:hypothetical protein
VPKNLQYLLGHADELARRFEEHEPGETRDATPLRAIRDAVIARSQAEQQVAKAVCQARDEHVPWAAIGMVLGTSGEAARQRYGMPCRQEAQD